MTMRRLQDAKRRSRFRLGRFVMGCALLAGCGGDREDRPPFAVAGGEAARGPALIREYGCHACHTIPGVRGATALVGPPLTHWSRRIYIAGLVQNTPQYLVAWIQNPQSIHPESAMPNMGVTAEEARHIAAYLYTLR
jgi:cytochrome c